MNKLTIYTRSYIDNEGHWHIKNSLIAEMSNITKYDNIEWLLLISGTDNLEPYLEIELPEYVNVITYSNKLSASEARLEILRYLIVKYQNESGVNRYFMNLDSDDLPCCIGKLSTLISDSNDGLNLIGFGLKLSNISKLDYQWTFNEDYFREVRRYCTEQTETMFLFIHDLKVIDIILKSGWLTERTDNNESCEDTLMAISIAQYNFIHPGHQIMIGAVASNFIKYIEHEGQVSLLPDQKYKNKLNSILSTLGKLYVNSGVFYKFDDNKLIKYNPYE
jgi:hypothetical protein